MSAVRAAVYRLRQAAERAGMGPLAVALFHRPLGRARAWVRAGGPGGARRLEAARREMIDAASALPPLVPRGGPSLEVAYLTGAGVWEQTLFCFVSLYNQAGCSLTPVLYDDGTLTPEFAGRIQRVVPWAEFVTPSEVEARLDRVLPEAAYPTLRSRRRTYVHLRKLVDVRAGRDRPSLVLDSDMLFFRRPAALLDWLNAPDGGLYMDNTRSLYGYSDALMLRLADRPVRERVNVGVCGLVDPEIDWDRIEGWCRELEAREGPSYFLEQALTALWLSVSPSRSLSASDYVLCLVPRDVTDQAAVMRHYVLSARRPYLEAEWRSALSAVGDLPCP